VRGGLVDRIEAEARERMRSVRESHGWDHVQRVRTLALAICRAERGRVEIVEPAALLHDIGREAEEMSGGGVCHAEAGARMAEEILSAAGADPDLAREIVHCVAAHRFRGTLEPRSLEARILFDADKLDSIGAIGLGRAFLFAGEVGARLHNPEADPASRPARTSEDTALREFLVKLRFVKDRMFTRTGRGLAEGRHAFMEVFFAEMDTEIAARR